MADSKPLTPQEREALVRDLASNGICVCQSSEPGTCCETIPLRDETHFCAVVTGDA